MYKRLSVTAMLVCTILLLLGAVQAMAGSNRFIDDNDTVVLPRNTHPLAHMGTAAGYAQTSMPMEHMIMSLQIPAGKQAALDSFLKDQHNPASANYHRWLTPEEFGAKFGPAAEDVAAVSGWLASHGFTVEEVAKSGTWINFSGDVSKVERTFKTHIKEITVGGRLYHANESDPSIPRGLSDLVSGIVTLHNIPRQPKNTGAKPFASNDAVPNYTSGSSHYLAPGDFATIYNVKPLYSAGVDGTGQSIAIVGRTHPAASNWSSFRSTMGLPVNAPQVIVNGTDPGDLGSGEDTEANLDVEWSGAVAKNASIKFVTSKSTNTTDGVDLSAQYIVKNNLAPVMSLSFGSCESDMGATENAFYNNLWAQAAAQGITVMVSTGDSGAAGCSDPSIATGSAKAVNGLASTPYNVAVGGTQFKEGSGSYWSSANATYDTSALSYIPEGVWNESGSVSGGSGLWATGGGASLLYAKPAWQVAPGVPQDGKRDLPDVALSAAGHDGYLIITGGSLSSVGGTSAAAPSFAGLMALVVQKTGQRQGNANVRLYQMANSQYASGGASVFHDIVSGNNSVPGVTGFSGAAGYDQATGLGSVDANSMLGNWAAAQTATPDFSLAGISPLTVNTGAGATAPVQVSVSGGFNSAVSLSVSGLATGITASIAPATLAAPGSGSAILSVSVATGVAAGTSSFTVTATGGGVTHTQTVQLTVAAADFTLAATTPAAIIQGGSGSLQLSTAVTGGFNSTLALAVSGLPAGVTASFAPASIAAPGTGSSTLTLTVAAGASPATSTITVTASGAGISHTVQVPITVKSSAIYSSSFTDTWYAANVTGNAGKWTLTTSGTNPTATPHAGTYMAQFNSFTAASGNATRVYSGTNIAIPSGAKSATLSYWMFHDLNRPSNNDRFQPQVSSNGSSWSNVGSTVSRYNGTAGWSQHTADLSSYIGKTVLIGILGTSAAGYNMYLDNVAVTAQ
jgi:pseudomonalisin